LLGLAAIICFVVSDAHEAYVVVVGMETGITVLFLLVYLLKLDARMRFFFWPLADILNSVISALFFLVMSLFAMITRTNKGTLTGGV
ncbi:CKLF factor, partial [Buphagus erythrorhynchus]|nr:CKLF factor [Buphagus erythrorhynchus]